MKKGLLILALAIAAGILAFFLAHSKSVTNTDPVFLDSMPELVWLRTDLKLSDEQFSKVEQLHRDYQYAPKCAIGSSKVGLVSPNLPERRTA
jgi:hypothetical protein